MRTPAALILAVRRVLRALHAPPTPGSGYQRRETILETMDACDAGGSSVVSYVLEPDELARVARGLKVVERLDAATITTRCKAFDRAWAAHMRRERIRTGDPDYQAVRLAFAAGWSGARRWIEVPQ